MPYDGGDGDADGKVVPRPVRGSGYRKGTGQVW